MVALSPKSYLNRSQWQPFRESDSSQSESDRHSNGANSLQKYHSNNNRRHVHWDKSIHDMTASGFRVRRADGLRDEKSMSVSHRDRPIHSPQRQADIKVTHGSHKGKHFQSPQRERGEKMIDTSHGGQHVQLSYTQRDFKTSDTSHRGQHAQLTRTKVSHSQGKGQPFQRDARTSSHDQGRDQHVQYDARMISHNHGRSQHTQRDAMTTLHSQHRNQHAQQAARLVSYDQGSAHRAERNHRTRDATNSNANSRKYQPGPVGEFRCKPLLTQIYADIHAASLPGAIQATTDIAQLTLLEGRQISTQNWFQCNAALQTHAMFKVIEYAFAGQELCHNSRLADHIYAAAKSVCLQPDHELGRVEFVAKGELQLASRHASLAQEHGLMMLSILATSAAYREAARTLDDAAWKSFGMCIGTNFSSLEYFAKIRGLDWLSALKRIPQAQDMRPYIKQRFPDLQADHPHTYVVPTHNEPLRRPMYKGQNQVPIQSNQYSDRSFETHERPEGWASNKPYPSDPTTISKAVCDLCKTCKCACDPLNCNAIVKPLVEVTNYGEKGNGIRVLQPIKRGDILEEYVGEIKHIRDMDHNVYSFGLDFQGNSSSAYIDAQFLGNWTRFINHSCEASAKFELKVIGQRLRVMIVATKDVDMFDELTIDYGSFFWFHHKTLCKCGSRHCVSKSPPGTMDICDDTFPDIKNTSRTGGKQYGQDPPRPYCNFYR